MTATTDRDLFDADTAEILGIATAEQAAASDANGSEDGVILIDNDGNVHPVDADRAVFGPLRTVYVGE